MQGADSVTWTITQTDKTITIEEKVTGGQMGGGGGAGAPPAGAPPAGAPSAGGGPGGGGGRGAMMGGMVDHAPSISTVARLQARWAAVKFARKAAWSGDGNTLELVSKVSFQNKMAQK